jgi:geranylgeranyl diphosphate synthase, type II
MIGLSRKAKSQRISDFKHRKFSMHSFEELAKEFSIRFDRQHFPKSPATLYDPADYFLKLGGKRIRPVLCLMGNELFDDLHPHAWDVGSAIELFHNFTLIHDDIMDRAPLRRGMQTVHQKFGEPSALLAGDVMLVVAYEYLNRLRSSILNKILELFNTTAKQVCEGQQIDMDFEMAHKVDMNEYVHMIGLKTSVLLAASLQMGAILGGAGEGNQLHLFEFGKCLGLAFQIQDDYLDAFGDPLKFGKQLGGDILSNKKTFLLIKALDSASLRQVEQINQLLQANAADKVQQMLSIYKACGVDQWAKELKNTYMQAAFEHLEHIAVLSNRKEPLKELAKSLGQREY